MKIAVLTSGGDAPGMNAAVRAVARTALARRWEVVGIEAGYKGLLERHFRSLGSRDVGGGSPSTPNRCSTALPGRHADAGMAQCTSQRL